jgi:poly(A) polymerase
VLAHPRFRAGLDFLLLRCESGEVDAEIGSWWDKFKDGGEEERARMLLPEKAGGKRKRRRRKARAPSDEPVAAGS